MDFHVMDFHNIWNPLFWVVLWSQSLAQTKSFCRFPPSLKRHLGTNTKQPLKLIVVADRYKWTGNLATTNDRQFPMGFTFFFSPPINKCWFLGPTLASKKWWILSRPARDVTRSTCNTSWWWLPRDVPWARRCKSFPMAQWWRRFLWGPEL